jgi:two-component system response regulator FlrC
LRERKADIVVLGEHFLEKYSRLNGIDKPGVSQEVIDILENHDWPGNVRELENAIERSVLICRGGLIRHEHLYLDRDGNGIEILENNTATTTVLKPVPSVGITLRENEKRLIFEALEKVGGNKTKASEILGVSVRTIRNKLNEYKHDESMSASG